MPAYPDFCHRQYPPAILVSIGSDDVDCRIYGRKARPGMCLIRPGVALLSIGFGAALTLGLLVGLGVFEFTAQQIIPHRRNGDWKFDECVFVGDGTGAG